MRGRTANERHTAATPRPVRPPTYEIDLVLEDEDVLELHDLDGGQVLRRLGLRARLVAGDEQQSGVHHRGSVQHGGHQNIVTGAVREAEHGAKAT